MLDYRQYAESRSLLNTPPVFAIYVLMLITRWLRKEMGGLEGIAELNQRKARSLYEVLDAHPDFYLGHAQADSRSMMNVTFRLRDGELEKSFFKEAEKRGLTQLKGHRSVGGVRASIYNAMPLEGVEALRHFMTEFHKRHGRGGLASRVEQAQLLRRSTAPSDRRRVSSARVPRLIVRSSAEERLASALDWLRAEQDRPELPGPRRQPRRRR